MPSSQLAQVAPLAPHRVALSEASARQVAPFMQPVQHAPLEQTPPVHAVPFATFVWAQAPALHASVVHGLLSLQLVQTEPAAPQDAAVSEAIAVHVPVPSVPQPDVQHEPLSQRPPVHVVPLAQFVPGVHVPPALQVSPDVQMLPSSQAVAAARCWQTPPTQVSLVQGLLSSHVPDKPQFAHLFEALQNALAH